MFFLYILSLTCGILWAVDSQPAESKTETMPQQEVAVAKKAYSFHEILNPLLQKAEEALKGRYKDGLPESIVKRITIVKKVMPCGFPLFPLNALKKPSECVPQEVAAAYLDLESEQSKKMIQRFIDFCMQGQQK